MQMEPGLDQLLCSDHVQKVGNVKAVEELMIMLLSYLVVYFTY